MEAVISAIVRFKGLSIGTLVIGLGVILGFAFPPSSSQYPEPWATVSGVIGWTYFAAWSVSFWPQVFINWSRKSVAGLSLDYLALNILGFACYTAYNLAYYYSPAVRAEYAAQYGGFPGVQSNDVFFAVHAAALTIIVGLQAVFYEREGQTVSRITMLMLATGVSFVVIYGALAGVYDAKSGGPGGQYTWLKFCLNLSYVKLAISCSKYIPQVILNYRRRSTVGWSIENVLLDFTGGLLSVGQIVGDAQSIHDWTIITGDPVKFGLGLISMVFDLIFMLQHFCLYRGKDEEGGAKYSPLGTAEGV